ncbi:MAG TPA: zf-HC2 domain-containing protein [Chthonomonadaceae bacterium]|nr:zf-HC2 domain-containing protein [Chthonomonadaceae bacterium]
MLNRPNLDNTATSEDAGNPSLPGLPSVTFAVVPPTDIAVGRNGGGDDACRLVQANLSAYQDNELDPDQRQKIEAHLAKCPECAAGLEALQRVDSLLEREWRECAPLPSSLEHKNPLDNIMAALPPTPAETPTFAPKRVHSRGRWMRFSTGLAGIIAFFSLLWSSYRLGYAHGRMSVAAASPSPTQYTNNHKHSSLLKLLPITYTTSAIPYNNAVTAFVTSAPLKAPPSPSIPRTMR